MAIAAAAIFLLLAAVGGGVDMSRAYMTRTNLQSACDAGVLAGRKALSKSGEYADVEKGKADKMFNFNMKADATDASDVAFSSQANEDGSVSGTASATMPTVIMHMFNFKDFHLAVECSAELQMASADIIFVLDNTLSMNCRATDNNCQSASSEYTSGGKKASRLEALRDAVEDFHLTLSKSVTDHDDTVIRYAFVPYSATVNISGLLSSGDFDPAWLASEAEYRTRVAKFDENTMDWSIEKSTNLTDPEIAETTKKSRSSCQDWANREEIISGTKPQTSTLWVYKFESYNSNSDKCTSAKTKVERVYSQTPHYKFTGWANEKATIPTADIISGEAKLVTGLRNDAGNPATSPDWGRFDPYTLASKTGIDGITNTEDSVWGGCIEERYTVHDEDMDPVPDDTWDLNINDAPTVGTSEAARRTQWKPYWPDVVFRSGSSHLGTHCPPTPIALFQTVETTEAAVPDWLHTYLINMKAEGWTYHDIGMIWAARIGSTRGMFKDNVIQENRPSVSRHVIFMTDGIMNPGADQYSAYGVESLDRRVAPSGANLKTYHNNRFLAACAAAEREGYTVWVIAFGKDITVEMKNCSTADRWYHAEDTTGLSNAFKYIAGQVADLRINK